MVLSLPAYVHASITTPDHYFDAWFAFLLFAIDVFIAVTISLALAHG